MTEYIEREAAIDTVDKAPCWRNSDDWYYHANVIESCLRALPAADVREVVTCGECIYAYPYGLEIKCTKHSGRAEKIGEVASYSEFHSGNWYCADAQRKREKHE